jgi:hypothetical protein
MWIALLALAVIMPAAVAVIGLKTPLNRRPPGDEGFPFGGL